MLMWELFKEGRPATEIWCDYNEETGWYVITMKKGYKKKHKKFKAKVVPENGFMFIQDVEKAVKLMNILEKEFYS